jgi:hypothetical protein
MDIIYDILFVGFKFFAVFLVIVSLVMGALILFKPSSAANINIFFNKWFKTEDISKSMETEISTVDLFIKYRFILGVPLCIGAIYTTYYLISIFDQSGFISMVVKPSTETKELFVVILMDVTRWFFVLWCLIGAFLCLIMTFAPDKFKEITKSLDSFFSTEKVESLIDAPHDTIDNWVLRNHIIVGFILLMGSAFLFAICLNYFF